MTPPGKTGVNERSPGLHSDGKHPRVEDNDVIGDDFSTSATLDLTIDENAPVINGRLGFTATRDETLEFQYLLEFHRLVSYDYFTFTRTFVHRGAVLSTRCMGCV